MRIEVVYSPGPRQVDRAEFEVPAGHTLIQAVEASGILARYGLTPAQVRMGIWGRVQAGHTPVRDGDRVEIYRPLQADPKESRRRRQRQQKPKSQPRSV